jgi:murein L,D-transpeptidase YcbB/YkuD
VKIRGRNALLAGVAIAGFGAVGAGLNLRESAREAAVPPAADLRLVVNVPAYRLDVYESGRLTRSYDVAVGKPGHSTPRGSYHISRAVWNPWWHPPNSRWARGRQPEPPGERNPMGRVKLYFRNLYYIHGTPPGTPMGEPASHGCIRMRNRDVLELARLVHRYANPDLSQADIDRLENNPRSTRNINLRTRIPLEISYDLVEVRGNRIDIYRDVYGVGGRVNRDQVMRAIAAAGHDTSVIDTEQIDQLIRDARRRNVHATIENLALAPAAATAADGS